MLRSKKQPRPMLRRVGLRHGVKRPRRVPMLCQKPGNRRLKTIDKQGKINQKANAQLARDFKGPQYCEARLPGCWGDVALSWSHHSKRRKLSAEELTEAALMCVPCHEQWEHLPPEELKANVKGLIAKRETQLPEAA